MFVQFTRQAVNRACSLMVLSQRISGVVYPSVTIVLCEFENFAVTSDAIKRIFMNFKNFVKFANFYQFLARKILNLCGELFSA